MMASLSRAELEELRQRPATVACGSCHSCCKMDAIRLSEKDDLAKYQWHLEDGMPTLDRKQNGECIYLAAKGCSIHGAAPDICRRFDCRVLFLITPKERRRIRIEQNPTMGGVYDAGKRRLDSLERPTSKE